MRPLLAALSALIAVAALSAGFYGLLTVYQRHHEASAEAEVTLDRDGLIRVDGQPIALTHLQGLFQDRQFRAQHCGRWRLEPLPGAPADRVATVRALLACR